MTARALQCRRAGGTGLAILALAAPLAGCASYSGGHAGTCRYGLKGPGRSGNHCYQRPRPSGALIAKAMSGEALARAVTAWSSTRGTARVSSVGINRWAETTFAVAGGATGIGAKHDRLLTFDADGAPTSGDEGYASDPRGPFPVSEVRPDVLARVLRKIRSGQPGTVLLAAILTAGPFSHTLQWHVTVVSEAAGSSLVYEAAPDGSGLCHGPDVVDDALVASSEIPPCAGPVHSGYFLTR